jgi:hypothetical protein
MLELGATTSRLWSFSIKEYIQGLEQLRGHLTKQRQPDAIATIECLRSSSDPGLPESTIAAETGAVSS